MLTALAMGARELAGMKVPEPQATRKIDFPSKTLPPALHKKYVGPTDLPPALGGRQPDQLEQAIDGVRGLLISKSAKRGEEEHPELAREKRLRVGPKRRTMVAEQGSLAARQADERAAQPHSPVVPFAEVAAEYFIMPLINRFWQHFQDIGIRESRAVVAGNRFRGAGAGMVMSAMALEKLLMTLSLMLHAARHSPVFLAVLSPEALELGLTIGLRHPNKPEDHLIEPESGENGGEAPRAEAQVLGAALELALVALDGAAELDQGRTMAMDKPELVLALGEWASGVFDVESKGGMVAAGQGGREGRIRAGAAAVVVKVAEVGEKWGHLGLPRMR
jgi:telomere length regulation protein